MRIATSKLADLAVAMACAAAAVVFSLAALSAQAQSPALADAQRGDGRRQGAMATYLGVAAPSGDDEGALEIPAADSPLAQADEVWMSVRPTRTVVALGEIFTVAVAIEDAPEISGYDFKMDWNPAVFSVTTVTKTDFMGTAGGQVQDINNDIGTLVFGQFFYPWGLPDELPSGDGELAIITLQATGVGTSTLDLRATRVFTRSGGQIRIADPGDGVAEAKWEAAGFQFSAIGDQVAGRPFTVTTTAVDEHGTPVDTFSGTVDLSDTTGTLVPSQLEFEGDAAAVTVPMTITQAATGVSIAAQWTKAGGGTIGGASNLFTVTHSTAVSVDIAPDMGTVMAGDCLTYTLAAADTYGNPWGVTDEATFDIEDDAQGIWTENEYCSAKAGSWQVIGTYDTLSDTTQLTVQPGEVSRIEVTPSGVTLAPGETQPFTATCYDAFDNGTACTPTWSADAEAGSIDEATGVFTAGTTAGSYPGAVVAAAGAVTGTADVTVTAGELARVVVSPSGVTLVPEETQAFTATGYDGFDNQVAITPTWSVADAMAGSIDEATGLFTAGTTAGSYLGAVVAAAEGVTGTADVTVTEGELDRIAVSPSAVTLAPEGTQPFAATCYDAFDNEMICSVAWSVADAEAGSIDEATGLFTAGTTAGSYAGAVVAAAGGVTGTADVTVTAGQLVLIAVTPSEVTLIPQETQAFTATGYDVYDNAMTIVPSWSVADAMAGSIDEATGVFTAGMPGEYPGAVVAATEGVTGTADVTVEPFRILLPIIQQRFGLFRILLPVIQKNQP